MIDQKIYTFSMLYETMNYHETAARLNMTQPAVTQHIKALENEYKCRLFIYNRRTLTATPAADILEQYSKSAIYNEQMLSRRLIKPSLSCYRIGATKSIGEYMISDMLAKFLSDSSRTAEVTVDNTENLLHMLDHNKLDFTILEGSFSKVKYGYSLFRKESLTGICSKDHRFAGKAISIDDALKETFIMREKGSGTRNIFEESLAENGLSLTEFHRVVTISEFPLLCQLVSKSAGVSFVYSSVAKGEKDIAEFSIKEIHPVHELNYVYLKNTNAKALIDKFVL